MVKSPEDTFVQHGETSCRWCPRRPQLICRHGKNGSARRRGGGCMVGPCQEGDPGSLQVRKEPIPSFSCSSFFVDDTDFRDFSSVAGILGYNEIVAFLYVQKGYKLDRCSICSYQCDMLDR